MDDDLRKVDAYKAGYREGADDMRERAAASIADHGDGVRAYERAMIILNLPLEKDDE